MTQEEKMLKWVNEEKQKSVDAGEDQFLGWPDKWYEPIHWCCENGHVSTRVLKSEALGGDVCLACYKFVQICPDIQEQELQQILGISIPAQD